MIESETERRIKYKEIWYQMKQAEKEKGFNPNYWDMQLEKYRLHKKHSVPTSKTKEYKAMFSRRNYHKNKAKVQLSTYRSGLKYMIKSDLSTLKQLETLNELIEKRLN